MQFKKKIIFLTGTRADFGKIKSLIQILDSHQNFEVFVFVTGMHLQQEYGYTLLEIQRCNFKNIHTYENHTHEITMDLTLANTITGFSAFCKETKPDLIVVHGDRVETLAGAIVGALNNILVAHIEGGELSGTVDELIRHSVSKLSHVHFVSSQQAKKRLIQMGEISASVFVIGSPDLDILSSASLPVLDVVKRYYQINFEHYAVVMFHPVTTEIQNMQHYVNTVVQALLQDGNNYVVVYPNNDLGSTTILKSYESLKNNPRFRIIPSLRFEYFLTLLKSARFLLGNSSAGIHEAPYLGIPVINIGSRQNNRSSNADIINVDYNSDAILESIISAENMQINPLEIDPEQPNSAQKFLESLESERFWKLNHQKQFRDL